MERFKDNNKKTLKEYQDWIETLLTPEELSEKLTKLYKRTMSIKTIARERKENGLPVGQVIRGKPLYDLQDVLKHFEKKAEDENSSKMKELKS